MARLVAAPQYWVHVQADWDLHQAWGARSQGVLMTRVEVQRRVRICAKKVVAGVRSSAGLLRIRSRDPNQCASAQQTDQLEGLAVARP